MINKQLINLSSPASGGGNAGEEGLILHLDANDVDSYDGDGTEWVDITNHEYTPTTNVSEHFNTVTYTGTGTTNPITVGFQPDLIWIKNRDQTDSYAIVDSVRGITSPAPYLASNETNAEATSTNMPTSVQSDGFTITGSGGRTNTNGEDYVAWCFKAGGAPSGSDKVSIDGTSYATMSAAGLTDGSSLVDKLSVNTKLGFSIVKTNTGITNNSQTKTISHGLGTKPELIIQKALDNPYNWWSYVGGATGGIYDYIGLNTTSAVASGSSTYPFGNPDSNFFTVNGAYVSNNIIAYCFASKRGVSKVGSYKGTGAAGNKVYTGFEPAFILGKRTNSTGSWEIIDNKRGGNKKLYPDLNNSEYTSGQTIHFNSDGFTLDGTGLNASGSTYIYYAVAKNTNETSLIPTKDSFTAGSVETTGLELDLDANTYSGSGNWLDGTSNDYDGTITGATYVNNGSADYFSFDGNDIIKNTSLGTAFSNQTTLSIEAWFRTSASTARVTIASFSNTAVNSTDLWIGFYANENTIAFRSQVDGQSSYLQVNDSGGSSLRDGNWHHVVFTANLEGTKIYVDGSELSGYTYNFGNSSTPIQMVSINQFSIGANQDSTASGGQWFINGDIGQVRVYSSSLTANQVKSNYEATRIYNVPDLELHLDAASFPEKGESGYSNTPSTWTDSSGNSNNGTITSATFDSELGNWLDFDGSASRINISSNFGGITNIQATSMWFKTTSTSLGMLFSVGANSSQYGGMYIYIDGSGIIKGGYLGNTGGFLNNSAVSSSSGYNDGHWHHLVLVLTGTYASNQNPTLYIDGNDVGTIISSSSTTQGTVNNASAIGYYPQGNRFYFNGQIGQVRVYSSALTQDQVRQNYNFTKPNYPNGFDGTITGATWNPDGYFNFDGNGDYISLNQGNNMSGGFFNNFSISYWVKLDTTSTLGRHFYAHSSSSNYILLYYNHSEGGMRLGGSNINTQTASYTMSANTWYHIVLTQSSENVSLYVDTSRKINSNQSIGTYDDMKVTLGAADQNGSITSSLDGKISKFKLYDKILITTEIDTLHSEGA